MMSSTTPKATAPWIYRFGVKCFTVILGLLIYWLLGFFVRDVDSIQGPDYSEVEERYINNALPDQEQELRGQIADVQRLILQQKEKQRLLAASTQGLQKTMGQILDLQKLSIEKGLAVSAEQTAAFQESMNVFLENQKDYQTINDEIATQVDSQVELDKQLRQVTASLEKQREPVSEEFKRLSKQHNNKLAAFKLLILIPLFLVSGFLVLKKRGHTYFPLVLAFAAAVSVKMALVIHEHFPSRYFKYIVLIVCLAASVRILLFLIRSIVAPRADRLIRQYREAYERFLCPVCEYPIRRGPMRFLYWNRRTIKKLSITSTSPGSENGDPVETGYVCPSCSTKLYGECCACKKVRHTLLPYCEHCGDEQPSGSLETGTASSTNQ